MGHILFMGALNLIVLVALTSAETYYVTSSAHIPCPEMDLPCFTLTEYADKPNDYFASNTTLIFLPGNHTLDSVLMFKYMADLNIKVHSHSLAWISCTSESAKFNIDTVGVVKIQGLMLLGCVYNDLTSVKNFTLSNCRMDGQGRNGIALSLDKMNVTVLESSFVSYTGPDPGDYPFLGDAKVGGAILAFSSTVLFSHCELSNNSVTYFKNAAGGAVYAFRSSVVFDNCVFHNNGVTSFNGRGGAVYLIPGVLPKYRHITINNSTFINNTVKAIMRHSSGSGGAVYVQELFPGHYSLALIYRATFTNNSVIDNGGAVYIHAESGQQIVSDSLFMSNTVSGSLGKGGALYMWGNTTAVNTSTFINNAVLFGGIGGGAIYFDVNGSLTLNHSTFFNNIVRSELVGANDSTCHCNVTTHGGAVHANSSIIEIISSTFRNNIATGGGDGGAVYANTSVIHISDSTFGHNGVDRGGGGGAMHADTCIITVTDSTFENNIADGCKFRGFGMGGALYVSWSPRIIISNSKFISNTVTTCSSGFIGDGGAVYIYFSTVEVLSSTFTCNAATSNGGAMYLAGDAIYRNGTVSTLASLNNCRFQDNVVTEQGGNGGALYADVGANIRVNRSVFINNTVPGEYYGESGGGAIYARSQYIAITNSMFSKNVALFGDGGAMYLFGRKTVYFGELLFNDYIIDYEPSETFATLTNCTFVNNTAVIGRGGALFLRTTNVKSYELLDIYSNNGGTGVVYAVQSSLAFNGITTLFNNTGSLFVFSCNVSIVGHINITSNSPSDDMSQEGGAVTSIQSKIFFTGTTNLIHNKALSGGAISASESQLSLYRNMSITNNTAALGGGGIYAYQCDINLVGNVTIAGNFAGEKGGGIHAISTTTKLTNGPRIYITRNQATNGGGVCLELNSKFYVVKTQPECSRLKHGVECLTNRSMWCRVEFSENSADFGGALFVNDTTNSGTCFATPFKDVTTSTECFFQNLGLHQYHEPDLNILNTYFANNFAQEAGSIVYGGMLDRCRVSAFTEYFDVLNFSNSTQESLSATSYMTSISNIFNEDFSSPRMISSKAVRLCFCREGLQDCSYHPPSKFVRKGETFNVSLVAVDQVNNTIPSSIIHASLSLGAKLGEGQSIQQTNLNGTCTELTYTVLSEEVSERLYLYADGPCMDIGISTTSVVINIAPCPIGFEDINQRCNCDPRLKDEYVFNCSIDDETVQRLDNTWFMYENTTLHKSYILHKHCPFDYCRPPTSKVFVNLNTDKGYTAICAFNRSGKLCGSCRDGYSLSLGSSCCQQCSNNWLALLIVFAVAGVVLVAFLLECKLTVDTGSMNGLIFYANIFVTNRTIFFPSDSMSIFSTLFKIFIAWLNLDFGFETCFYNGLDSYIKIWLQFAFPLYVISLVVAIIIVCEYSSKFSGLFIGKNPIATLATLILLSYTKLLRTIIASLSFTLLEYSDGSRELVWLIDGNVPYLRGKHIPLFVVAVIFLIFGLVYTLLLFSWQWIVNPKIRIFNWITKHSKIIAFMDAYHNPFHKDHRYWIGLLLLTRVVLYMVSAVNVFGSPDTNLLSISLTIAFLIFFQLAVVYVYGDKVHKERCVYAFESISFLNLLGLTSVTFYMTEGKSNQSVIAYVSISLAFISFLIILALHTYMYVLRKPLEKMYKKLRGQSIVLQDPTAQSEYATFEVDLDEESVPVTEVDASPEALNTDEMVEHEVTDESHSITVSSNVGSEIDTEDRHVSMMQSINTSGCSPPTWIIPYTAMANKNSNDIDVELHTLTATYDQSALLVLSDSQQLHCEGETLPDSENVPLLV